MPGVKQEPGTLFGKTVSSRDLPSYDASQDKAQGKITSLTFNLKLNVISTLTKNTLS